MDQFQQVVPFINMTRGATKQNFRGIWETENSLAPFNQNYGVAELSILTKSFKFTNFVDLYQHLISEPYQDKETQNPNKTLRSEFLIQVKLLDDKYVDNSLHIYFQFTIDGKRERSSMFDQGSL